MNRDDDESRGASAFYTFIAFVFIAGFGAGLFAGMAVGHRDALATISALKAEEGRR